MTVAVAAGALVLALVLGLVIALLRMSRSRLFSGFAYIYTEFLRGTPALAQLFVIYFGLPDIGIELRPVEAAIVGLGINGSAYLSEVYRAGIQAIHRGQFEAAFSLGMTPIGSMRYIVLPQAVRMMLPPITNSIKRRPSKRRVLRPQSRDRDVPEHARLSACRSNLSGDDHPDVATRGLSRAHPTGLAMRKSHAATDRGL